MALSFPADKALFAGLRVRSASCHLSESRVLSGRTAGGSVLTASSGFRLWTGKVELVAMANCKALAVTAKLSILQEPGSSFLASPVPGRFPALDPDGSRLGEAVPVLSVNAADPRQGRITGLPEGYTLLAGDAFSVIYGSNPQRHGYHRVVADRVVGGAKGQTPFFQVTPPLPLAAEGAPVTLLRPAFKAVLLPDSLTAGTTTPGGITTGIGFEYLQTLR